MADNSVNKSITIDIDDDDDTIKQVNTFSDAIKEMGNVIHTRYPDKTSNISQENANGIIRVEVLNEYMNRNFGYEYESLKVLCSQKKVNVVSVKGWGIDKFIEAIKSIQASFEQMQMPEGIMNRLRGR